MLLRHGLLFFMSSLFSFQLLLITPSHIIAKNLDAPHDSVFGTGCLTCHDMTAFDQANLIPNGVFTPDPADIDWTLYNSLCWGCHAVTVKTHSSSQVSNKYGDWTVECWVCHNQHAQEQNRTYETNYGKFIRTRIDLSKIIGVAKTDQKNVRFTGTSEFANGDTTYDGICEVCHTLAKNHKNTSAGNHTHYAGLDCTICHAHDKGFVAECAGCHNFPPVDAATLVSPISYPPVGTGSVTAGAHATHATDNDYSCEHCHANNPGIGPNHVTDLTVTMGFNLFEGARLGGTYNGQTTVSYDTNDAGLTSVTNTGAKTCSKIYCHGQNPDGTNWDYNMWMPNANLKTTPVWDGTVACGECHGATAASGPSGWDGHMKHVREIDLWYGKPNHSYPCSYCHKDPTIDNSLHANGKSEVVLSSSNPLTTGGVYNGSDDMKGAVGRCTNLYCHSTAQSSPPGAAPEYRTTLLWNWTYNAMEMPCSVCHYYSFTDPATLTTGSHAPHFYSDANAECGTCHSYTGNYSGIDEVCGPCHPTFDDPAHQDNHVNHNVDVAFSSSTDSYSGTGTPDDAYGSCLNIYCHSDGKSVASPTLFPVAVGPIPWGAPIPDPQADDFSCNNCHQYPPINDSHEVHVTTRGYVCSNCHADTTQDNITIDDGIIDADPTIVTNHGNSHTNHVFDVSPSGQFVDPSSASLDIDFVYTPMTVDAFNDGGQCSSNACHAAWSITDPVRWKYTP